MRVPVTVRSRLDAKEIVEAPVDEVFLNTESLLVVALFATAMSANPSLLKSAMAV